jgi:hypothetical protein
MPVLSISLICIDKEFQGIDKLQTAQNKAFLINTPAEPLHALLNIQPIARQMIKKSRRMFMKIKQVNTDLSSLYEEWDTEQEGDNNHSIQSLVLFTPSATMNT